MSSITLSKLLDLAIGSPEVGAVNFNNLYRLLHALLKKLDLNEHEMSVDDNNADIFTSNNVLVISGATSQDGLSSSPYHKLDSRVKWLTGQLDELNALPSTAVLTEQMRAEGDGQKVLSDMWQYIQLKKRVDANEEGISKLLAIAGDVMKKLEDVRDSNCKLVEQLGELDLDGLVDRIDAIEGSISMLCDRINQLMNPDSPFITWDSLETALSGVSSNKNPVGDVGDVGSSGYGAMLLKMQPKERQDFIEEAIASDTLHQYLPNVNADFINSTPEERRKFIEDAITNASFVDLLPQSGGDLLKMTPKERQGFIQDSIGNNTLRDFLPGLENDFETKDPSKQLETVEDNIQAGSLHKFFPCKYKNVEEMTPRQLRTSIESVIKTDVVQSFLPNIEDLFEKKDSQELEKFWQTAVKQGLVEAYQEATGTAPKPMPEDVKREIEKAILQECQSLMYADNGHIETDLAREGKTPEVQSVSRHSSLQVQDSTETDGTPSLQSTGNISSQQNDNKPQLDSTERRQSQQNETKSPPDSTGRRQSQQSDNKSPTDSTGRKQSQQYDNISPLKSTGRRQSQQRDSKSPLDSTGRRQSQQHDNKSALDSTGRRQSQQRDSKSPLDSTGRTSSRQNDTESPQSEDHSDQRPGRPISRPGTGQSSRGSTPTALLAYLSPGPSTNILEILDRLGMLYQQHSRLIQWVKSINEKMKKKAKKDHVNQLAEKVQNLADLLNKQLGNKDILEQLSALQNSVGAIQLLVDEIKAPPNPEVGRRVSNSGAFADLMDRVCGIESKLTGFQDSIRGRDSAYSSEDLSFLQDSISEISSDPDVDELRRRRRKSKQKGGQDDSVKGSAYESLYAKAEKGSVTFNILAMIAEMNVSADDVGSERLKRTGLILDEQLNNVRDALSGLESDLKLMAKGVEVAIQRFKVVDNDSAVPKRVPKSSGTNIDGEALQRAQEAITHLREEIDHLQLTTRGIIASNSIKQEQIEEVMLKSAELFEVKADKEFVMGECKAKADKRLVEGKVNQTLFNKATDEINNMIKEVEGKLSGNESAMNNLFHQLTEDVDGKIDRLEMDPLKGWIESKLKELNSKIAKVQPGWSEDDAAGLRKQLIQRFHCLSCDKSINIMPKKPIPSLPSQTSLPNTRSPRPYTIYELNQIRQHTAKGVMSQNIMNFERALLERQLARIRKSDLRAFLVHYTNELSTLGIKKNVAMVGNQETSDFYARTRACGGLHTMTFPHRRPIRVAGINNNVYEEELKQNQIEETHHECGEEADVQGADGIIYKGRCLHQDKVNGPKGVKIVHRTTSGSPVPSPISKPAPTPSGRPVSALNRGQARPSSGRSGSRPVSARPNTVNGSSSQEQTRAEKKE